MTNWIVSSLKIAENNIKGDNNDLTLTCQLVSEVGAVFREKKGGDGEISRTIVENRKLLVVTSDASKVKNIGWKPNYLIFTDLNTGKIVQFTISKTSVKGSDVIEFTIDE